MAAPFIDKKTLTDFAAINLVEGYDHCTKTTPDCGDLQCDFVQFATIESVTGTEELAVFCFGACCRCSQIWWENGSARSLRVMRSLCASCSS